MDYEKMLRVYMLHVCYEEGTTFATETRGLVKLGLSYDEAHRVVTLANEQYKVYKQETQS